MKESDSTKSTQILHYGLLNANPTWGKITAIRASQHLQYKIPNTTNKNPEATVEGEENHRPRPTTFPITHYPTNVAVFWSQDKGVTTCKTSKRMRRSLRWQEPAREGGVSDLSLAGAATSTIFVTTKDVFVASKHVFVATNILFREKRFVTTNMCLSR